jgi:SNF2 family DNA or RNA helicase
MRLGKTLVVIRRVALHKYEDPKILVAMPMSAIGGWEDELTEEGENYVVLCGDKAKRLKTLEDNADVNWFLINKEGLLSIKQVAILPWDIVIFDESHWIKNPKAQITKYMLKYFRRAKHRWVLTGTPNPESSLEFVCQMIFLNGEFCGCKDYWSFRAKYYEPEAFGYGWKPKKGSIEIIQKELSQKAFILSRKDAGMDRVKVRENRYFEFPPEIQKIYNEMEESFALDLPSKKLSGGWLSTDDFIWNGKVKELESLLSNELKGEKVVVWFNYNLEIKAVLQYLNKRRKNWEVASITGETPQSIRETTRKDFNKGDLQLLLLQQKVAQTGMDLSGADTAIYYSEPEGLTARQQTEDRILSLNKDGPLLYVNFLVKDSVDMDLRHANSAKALKSNVMLSKVLKQSLIERRCKNVSSKKTRTISKKR